MAEFLPTQPSQTHLTCTSERLVDYRSRLTYLGRTLEETAALFDGESAPRDLAMTGGEAATMTMNRGGPQSLSAVSARIFADRVNRYEKVLSQTSRSSHGSGFTNGFNFGRGPGGGNGVGNGGVATTDFLELQRTPTKDKDLDVDVFDHDLHADRKERARDRDRSLSPLSRDSDSV